MSFSISNADPVEEGKAIVFHITRSGDDGQAHEVGLDYPKNANLLADHPRTFRFEPGEPSQRDLSLNTVPGLPGDGNNDVEVALVPTKGTEIGVPRVGTGTITDVPLPPQPVKSTYRIAPNGPASRGSDLNFTVTRTPPFESARLAYSVSQDGATLTLDASPQPVVEFPEGVDRATLVVPGSLYSRCGSPPAVTLEDGLATAAPANFSNPPPSECDVRPKKPWWEDYLALLIGGVAFVGGVIGHYFLPRPPVDPRPPGPHDGEKPPESLDDIQTSLDIKPGPASFHPLEEPASRWPRFSADVVIQPGGFHVTQPLPRLEPDDG